MPIFVLYANSLARNKQLIVLSTFLVVMLSVEVYQCMFNDTYFFFQINYEYFYIIRDIIATTTNKVTFKVSRRQHNFVQVDMITLPKN